MCNSKDKNIDVIDKKEESIAGLLISQLDAINEGEVVSFADFKAKKDDADVFTDLPQESDIVNVHIDSVTCTFVEGKQGDDRFPINKPLSFEEMQAKIYEEDYKVANVNVELIGYDKFYYNADITIDGKKETYSDGRLDLGDGFKYGAENVSIKYMMMHYLPKYDQFNGKKIVIDNPDVKYDIDAYKSKYGTREENIDKFIAEHPVELPQGKDYSAKATVEEGDIFYTSDSDNYYGKRYYDFFKVVRATKASAWVKPLKCSYIEVPEKVEEGTGSNKFFMVDKVKYTVPTDEVIDAEAFGIDFDKPFRIGTSYDKKPLLMQGSRSKVYLSAWKGKALKEGLEMKKSIYAQLNEELSKFIDEKLIKPELTPLPKKEAKFKAGDKVIVKGEKGEIIKVKPLKLSDTSAYQIKLDSGKSIWRYEEEIEKVIDWNSKDEGTWKQLHKGSYLKEGKDFRIELDYMASGWVVDVIIGKEKDRFKGKTAQEALNNAAKQFSNIPSNVFIAPITIKNEEIKESIEDNSDIREFEKDMLVKKSSKNESTELKAGNTVTFDTHGNDSELNSRSGQKVTIIRPLTDDECDKADVGNMYKVKFKDGYEIDAFEDELIQESINEGLYGLKDVRYISHGDWADGEVEYQGFLYNAYDVTEFVYDDYVEFCNENGEEESDEGFEEWIKDNADYTYDALSCLTPHEAYAIFKNKKLEAIYGDADTAFTKAFEMGAKEQEDGYLTGKVQVAEMKDYKWYMMNRYVDMPLGDFIRDVEEKDWQHMQVVENYKKEQTASKTINESKEYPKMLSTLLRKCWYDGDGRFARYGRWTIGLGGYDHGYEVYYDGDTVVQIKPNNEVRFGRDERTVKEICGYDYEQILKAIQEVEPECFIDDEQRYRLVVKVAEEKEKEVEEIISGAIISEHGSYSGLTYWLLDDSDEDFLDEIKDKLQNSGIDFEELKGPFEVD